MKMIDLTGQRFGRLTVIARASNTANSGQARWVCVCDCGGTTTTHGSNLRGGKTTSCGCAVADANRDRLQTHGQSKTGGRPGHDLYQIWTGIRRRCLSVSDKAYPRYGGRGIKIAEVWASDFKRFVEDVGPRPSKLHSLDRIDNDGDYAPGNVRWATAQEQADNRGPVARLRRENADLLAEVERLREAWAADQLALIVARDRALDEARAALADTVPAAALRKALGAIRCNERDTAGRDICDQPAVAIAWGRLYRKEQGGPKCSEHFYEQHPPEVTPLGSAIVDLQPLRALLPEGPE